MRILAFVFLLVTGVLATPAMAAVLVLDESTQSVSPGLDLEVYEDASNNIGIDALRIAPLAEDFRPVKKEVPGFGFSASAYWMRFQVDMRDHSDARWMLEFAYPPMQWIDVYAIDSAGHVQSAKGGAGYPAAERQVWHRHHEFPLSLHAGERYTIYVRGAGETSKTFPLRLVRESHLHRDVAGELGIFGAVLGIALAFGLYNLLIWLMVRELAYLHYVLFMAASSVMVLCLTGFMQLWIVPQAPIIAVKALPVAILLSAATSILFTKSFIGIDALHGWVRTGFLWVARGALTLAAVVLIMPYHVAIVIAAFMLLLAAIALVVLSVNSIQQGSMAARHYLLAWCMLLLGSVFALMRNFGLVGTSVVTEYGVFFGWSAQSVLLSVGLAARMRSLREENNAAMRQLVASERMASLGLLSAGVAHEINNPNNFIRLSGQTVTVKLAETREFLLNLLDDDDAEIRSEINARFDAMRQQTGLIAEGTQRIGEIVQGMRSAARRDQLQKTVFDPVKGLENTLTLVKANWGKSVEFITDFIPDCKTVGFPSELNQVFMNLLVNACHAIEEKFGQGQVRGKGEVVVLTTIVENEVHIVLQDNGCGMSEAVRARLFEPFFTTKDEERGTGLGMSICRRIIEQHGGRIDVRSVEGEGTSFDIVLPLVTA